MGTLKLRKWNSADYLKTEEDMAEYLEACLEEAGDDPAFITQALATIAQAKGMAQLAHDTGISRESLDQAFSGARTPEFGIVLKVVKALGLRLHATTA